MADNDDSTAGSGGNGEDQIEAATSLYEGRLLIESARMGLETLAARQTPATVGELAILLKLMTQASGALGSAQQALYRIFGIEIGHA